MNSHDLFLNKTSGKDIFSGVDAVRMATINGAECMGIENDFGTIEVGKTCRKSMPPSSVIRSSLQAFMI